MKALWVPELLNKTSDSFFKSYCQNLDYKNLQPNRIKSPFIRKFMTPATAGEVTDSTVEEYLS